MQTVAGVGGSLLRARPAYVAEIEIPLPPIEEQRRIAAVLDAADELRTKRRQALAKLDTLTQAIFIDMFGDPIAEPRYPTVRIGDVAASATYGTSKKAGTTGEFAVLRMGNITYDGLLDLTSLKYVDLDLKEQPKHLVRAGDLLFNRTNSADLVGKTAVYRLDEPMAYAGYLIRLRLGERMTPEFLGQFMNLPSTKQSLRAKCKSIVGMANINAKELQAIDVPLPPVDLQWQFDKTVARIRAATGKPKRSTQQLEVLFDSLQQQAFTGELWHESEAANNE